jgi:hypothetical protein
VAIDKHEGLPQFALKLRKPMKLTSPHAVPVQAAGGSSSRRGVEDVRGCTAHLSALTKQTQSTRQLRQ